MAVDPLDLTTIANLKLWLGQVQNTDDTQIQRLLTAVSKYILRRIDRDLFSASYTERFDGDGQDFLVVSQWPLLTVTVVKISNYTIPVANADTQTPGYLFTKDGKIQLIGFTFDEGVQNVQVSYTAGYASIPSEIEQACISICGLWYRNRERIGQVSKQISGEIIAFSQADVPAEADEVLERWRRKA